MATTTVQHLGGLSIEAIASIRPVEIATGLCDELRSYGEIQAFLTRYGHELVIWDSVRGHWRSTKPTGKYSRIVVRMK